MFPENEKREIIAAFFEDAVRNDAADAGMVADFQKNVVETVDGLGAMKKELEDKDKLLQIKETI